MKLSFSHTIWSFVWGLFDFLRAHSFQWLPTSQASQLSFLINLIEVFVLYLQSSTALGLFVKTPYLLCLFEYKSIYIYRYASPKKKSHLLSALLSPKYFGMFYIPIF